MLNEAVFKDKALAGPAAEALAKRLDATEPPLERGWSGALDAAGDRAFKRILREVPGAQMANMSNANPKGMPTPAEFEYTSESPFANGLFVTVINAFAVAEFVISVDTLNVIS